MLKDEKPHGSANETANVAFPTAQDEWAIVRAKGELFEDILDIEGPIRSAMTAVAGFAVPGIDDIERGIALLDGRISSQATLDLRHRADDLKAAAEAGDAAEIRAAQGSIVDILAGLRQGD